jgi:hypothetical protein
MVFLYCVYFNCIWAKKKSIYVKISVILLEKNCVSRRLELVELANILNVSKAAEGRFRLFFSCSQTKAELARLIYYS